MSDMTGRRITEVARTPDGKGVVLYADGMTEDDVRQLRQYCRDMHTSDRVEVKMTKRAYGLAGLALFLLAVLIVQRSCGL